MSPQPSDNSGIPSWEGPQSDGPSGSFAAARSLKRELLAELREGWEQGRPVAPEELLGRWPGAPGEDRDAASVLFEDYLQRRERSVVVAPAEAEVDATSAAGAAVVTPPSLEEYEQRFPKQKDSLARLLDHHALLQSLGASDPSRAGGFRLALPAVGDEVFGFPLRQELGRGAFARVFLAEQTGLADRPVVLKVSAIEGDEPQTLAQLQHTNIVPIYSVHEDPQAGLRAVCMPYFGGASLSAVLRTLWADHSSPQTGSQLVASLAKVQTDSGAPPACGQLTPHGGTAQDARHGALDALRARSYIQATVWIITRLAEALQHAHDRGVLHRDIKPSNVLLAADGQPMLLDFNLAQHTSNGQVAAALGGTVAYMAPEHLRALAARDPALARLVDHRADIYALGMVLYEMLAGKSPFDQSASYSPLPALIEAMAVERSKVVPSLRKLRPDVPWSLESIARRCLAPDPRQRYQQAADLVEDLGRFLEDRPLWFAPELSYRERAAKWGRRHPRLLTSAAISGVALLVIAAGAALLVGTRAELEASHARVYEAQGAEALQRRQMFAVDHQRALCLVNTTTEFQDHVREGMTACVQALERYQILELDDWQTHRDWQRLAPADQEQLGQDIREVLLLLARARAHLALGQADRTLCQNLGGAFSMVAHLSCTAGGPAAAAALAMDLHLPANLLEGQAARADALRNALDLLARADAIQVVRPSAALWEERAFYLDRLGDREASARAHSRAMAMPPADARDHYWRATTQAFEGHYREAVTELDLALRLNPRHYWSWMQRGLSRLQLGEPALALGDFNACVALWPEFAWGYFNRGHVLSLLGKNHEALADYGAALERDPTFAVAYLNRALVLLDLNQPTAALADLAKVATLGRDDVKLHACRGLALESLGRSPEADQAFERAWTLDPHNGPLLLAYGFAVHRRLPRAAEAAFTRVLQGEARNPRAFYGLGMLAAARARASREALAFFTQAVEIDPTFVAARLGRANVLAHLCESDWARQECDWCVKAEPTGITLYGAACVYALIAEKSTSPSVAHWAATRGTTLLRGALERGYGLDKAETDGDLNGIRNRAEVQEMLSKKGP